MYRKKIECTLKKMVSLVLKSSLLERSRTNPKPNPNPDRGSIFLGGNCPDTLLEVCQKSSW